MVKVKIKKVKIFVNLYSSSSRTHL